MIGRIIEIIVHVLIASVLILIGFIFGLLEGTYREQEEIQRIHKKIGIELVEIKVVGKDTTYSYNVIDSNEENK